MKLLIADLRSSYPENVAAVRAHLRRIAPIGAADEAEFDDPHAVAFRVGEGRYVCVRATFLEEFWPSEIERRLARMELARRIAVMPPGSWLSVSAGGADLRFGVPA